MMPSPSAGELRALAAAQGVEIRDEDVEGLQGFLAVFLPALDGLDRLLPPEPRAAAPEPLGVE